VTSTKCLALWGIHHTNPIISEGILLFSFDLEHIAIHQVLTCPLRIKLSITILGSLWEVLWVYSIVTLGGKLQSLHIVHVLFISILRAFVSIITNKHDSDILVATVGLAVVHGVAMGTWWTTNLHLFQTTSICDFRALLMMEAVACQLELILLEFSWHLIGVSHLFVVGGLVVEHLLIHGVVLLDRSDSYVSVALSHCSASIILFSSFSICSRIARLIHRSSILILNSILSCL